jgi:AraC family transcriptional regulator
MAARRSTRLDYGTRVARAMAFIAANLDGVLDLERVADAAAFSPCHFHRIFRAIAGETLAEHIARARLSRAARDLVEARLPMPRIARRAGYASQAAFSRAFRAAHGVPPAAYRAGRGIGRVVPVPTPSTKEPAMFDVTVRDYPALRLAAVRHIGPYMQIGAAFDRLQAWGAARGLIGADTHFFGRYFDDPKSVPPAQCRAEAGFTVAQRVAGDDEVSIVSVPALSAAVLRFKGPYAELERTYEWLYGSWLPASGREPAEMPCMEEYLNDPRTLPPGEWLTDIIVPLKEKVAASLCDGSGQRPECRTHSGRWHQASGSPFS